MAKTESFFQGICRSLVSPFRRALGIQALLHQTEELRLGIERLGDISEFFSRDVLAVLANTSPIFADPEITLQTQHPVAIQSDDHKHPRGTGRDNTRYPRFCRSCEQIFSRRLRFLDLGCAGGGLVFDFLLRGHLGIGLEGSDHSKKWQRAEWRLLPQHLFTCDITKPFQVTASANHQIIPFDVISAWEVLEHLPESSLQSFFTNVRNHLADGGLFAASIATFEDSDPATGAVRHVTVKSRDWWVDKSKESGLIAVTGFFTPFDFPRGSGNILSRSGDWNVVTNPEKGFHLVLQKA